MKVLVTYTEVQYFKTTRVVEMTRKEYNRANRLGRVDAQLEAELCSECDEERHIITEHFNTDIDKI